MNSYKCVKHLFVKDGEICACLNSNGKDLLGGRGEHMRKKFYGSDVPESEERSDMSGIGGISFETGEKEDYRIHLGMLLECSVWLINLAFHVNYQVS